MAQLTQQPTANSQQPTANIVCMKWGTAYAAEYVNRLYRMLAANMSRPFRLVCFTDNQQAIIPEVEVYALPPFANAHLQTMGAYRKKTLCRKDLISFNEGERFLFLDLDVVIMGNIDALFDFEPQQDFIICRNWTRGNGRIGNSSVTMMRVGPLQYVVDAMENDFLAVQNQFKTASQEFFSAKIIEKYGKLCFWPDQWCRSFPFHCLPSRVLRRFKTPQPPPPDTKILVFHGPVKPPDALTGNWPGHYPVWKKWYKTVRPSPWLAPFLK